MKKVMLKFLALVAALALPICAMATDVAVSVQQIVNSGLSTAYTSTGLVASSNNYLFVNDGRVLLHFKKTGAGACTVAVTTPGTMGGLAIADLSVSVAATTGDVIVGPFPASLFNDANGKVTFTLSDTVGLSIAAFRL